MIPLKLQLTNFLSYRDTVVLEFEGIHLACISGLNGAGKSSILDGITWALFGRSRSKSDDDLVNRLAALEGKGADVRLTFALEGSTYRVIRRKKPRSTMFLELQIETDPKQWKTLSESKLRETQTVIETLLRMNYETFINASFLLQGKADEFTTKTPNRRKEILADLLGVSLWDRYKESAAIRRKEVESRLALIDGFMEDIALELAEEPEREAALLLAQQDAAAVRQRLTDQERLQQQLRRAEAAIQQQEQMVENLAGNLKRIEQSLASLEQTREQRQQERDHHQLILAEAGSIAASYADWQKAEAALQSWQARAEEYHQLLQAKRPHEQAITQAHSRLEQRLQELEIQAERAITALAERQTAEETLVQENSRLQQIDHAIADLAQREQQWHEAQAELQRLQSERQLLTQERDQLQLQAARMQALQAEKETVTVNLNEARRVLADLATRAAALAEQNRRYLTDMAQRDSLLAEQPRLHQEMDRLKQRLDQLDVSEEGECPLCGQSLTEARRQSVLDELKAEGKAAGDRFRANKEKIESLTVEVARLEELVKQGPRLERDQQTQQQRQAKAEARWGEIEQTLAEWTASDRAGRLAELEEALADETLLLRQQQQVAAQESVAQKKSELESERQAHQRQLSTVEARLAEVDRLLAEWAETGESARAEVQRRLTERDYATDAQLAVAELEAQSAELAYDSQSHDNARQARNELSLASARHQELKQAEAAVKPLEDALADLDRQIASQEQTAADMRQQHERAIQELATIAADSGDLRTVESEVFRLREAQAVVNQRLGAAQQKLHVLVDLRDRERQLRGERDEVTQLVARLKLLERACGRDGVQALLIEQALPDIEDRANEMLERLTGGDMHVTFDTQKQLKSREATVETLDIRIVDSAGERPYANFSGGEQFRVNFAVRLALSQVLAKRAGARLQTLVIDEGFGSQDPSGRQRLVEAINTIQDDFARILVITHIDELRDVFPNRIEVVKSVSGSALTIT